MKYKTVFQCETGQYVVAHYMVGRVSLTPANDDQEESVTAKTVAWCKTHRGQRFATLDAADAYIRTLSGGQVIGFEETE